jgi:hypothetical protein
MSTELIPAAQAGALANGKSGFILPAIIRPTRDLGSTPGVLHAAHLIGVSHWWTSHQRHPPRRADRGGRFPARIMPICNQARQISTLMTYVSPEIPSKLPLPTSSRRSNSDRSSKHQ